MNKNYTTMFKLVIIPPDDSTWFSNEYVQGELNAIRRALQITRFYRCPGVQVINTQTHQLHYQFGGTK